MASSAPTAPTSAPGPWPRPGARSERSRQAILDAARARFAAEGYERTTVRAVAADAGIDASMVMRYYGSKEGLFAAAADIDLRLPDLDGVEPGRLGEVLARHFVSLWEGGRADDALVVLLRTATTHEGGAERMREIFRTQAVPAVSAVAGGPDGERRAGLVGAQLLGVALCRYVLRLEPIASEDPESLVADLAGSVQRYLTGPLAAGGPDALAHPTRGWSKGQPPTGHVPRSRT
ncbi:TetR family transcriptional regulator [Acidiferrimicrobium sp. IK]|uniref:TetR/AcrR family transcriptional regulator n=1 Tax=Acidiferrimicrobium sp. IK TaxID=2871700 RepID=UPI0021CB528F|nr:TetR family transcriptional regulator [Acidiferrimicrobium sp. IK]MCU4185150.1 TetR family transcriptional regulator [Acidiferrimicrobium sp. IK]